MKTQDKSDTIIAPITSSTGGSVSLLRISGPESIAISNAFFAGKDITASEGGKFYFGKFKDGSNQIVDEVVISIFRSPNSFTGEDVVEVSLHANPFIIDRAIQLYLDAGCRIQDARGRRRDLIQPSDWRRSDGQGRSAKIDDAEFLRPASAPASCILRALPPASCLLPPLDSQHQTNA